MVYKQQKSGEWAQAAGYQTKKGVVEPLLKTEMSPGDTVKEALGLKHLILDESGPTRDKVPALLHCAV